MTLSVSNFFCKTCEIDFKGEYKPQQRPRKSCPKCHKMCEITKSNKKSDTETKGEQHSTLPPTTDIEDITSLTPESVEKLILDKLNNKSDIQDPLIRMALDVVIKLKIQGEEGMEELDMERFVYKDDIAKRQEESCSPVHETTE